MRRGFHQLIGFDVFDGALQREDAGRGKLDGVVLGSRAVVGEVFLTGGVHRDVDILRVFAHNHTFVHLITGGNEQRAALFHGLQGVGAGNAVFHGDEGAGLAGGDFAGVGGVFLEEVGEDAVAAGEVHQLELEADEAAGGNGGLDGGATAAVGLHVLEDAAAVAEDAHGAVGAFIRHFDEDGFEGLAVHAVNLTHNHLGAGDEHLVVLAAHLLHQNGNLHGAAGGYAEHAGQVGILHLDGDIRAHLAHQAVTDHTAGHVFAIAATQRTIVDAELHLYGGGLDSHEGKGLTFRVGGEGLADVDVLETGKTDDVAGLAHGGVGCLQTTVFEKFGHLGLHAGAILAQQVEGVALLHAAAGDAAHSHTAHVVIPVDVGDEHLERLVGVGILRGRDVLHNLVQQRGAVHRGFALGAVHEIAVAGGTVHKGSFELILCGVQVEQQLQHLVMHLHSVGMRAVNLVDDHDGQQPFLQSFAQHKAGLSLRAFVGIHHQNHAVHHLHHAFHLGAEVGVAGGVHDIDGVVIPVNGGVLGLDGDALLALQVHGVHGALLHLLVLTVGAAGFQKLVHQSGFAVVYVGDNGEIAEFAGITHNKNVLSRLLRLRRRV